MSENLSEKRFVMIWKLLIVVCATITITILPFAISALLKALAIFIPVIR